MKSALLILAAAAMAAPHAPRGDADGVFTFCNDGKGILCKNETFDTVHRCVALAETDQFKGWLCGDKLTKVNWHLHKSSGRLFRENKEFCEAREDGKGIGCK